MKKKTLGLLCAVALALIALVVVVSPRHASTPRMPEMMQTAGLTQTEDAVSTPKPAYAQRAVETCFVSWWKAGLLDICIFYEDGGFDCNICDVDEAKSLYDGNVDVMAAIEATAAKKRQVAWWHNDTDVLVGIGDTDDILPIDEALAKYEDNSVIYGKLQELQSSPPSTWRDAVIDLVRDDPAYGAAIMRAISNEAVKNIAID